MTDAVPAFLWVVRNRNSPGGVERVVQHLDAGLRALGLKSEVRAWHEATETATTARSWIVGRVLQRRRRHRAAEAFALKLQTRLSAEPGLVAVLEPTSIDVAQYLRGFPRWGLHVHWNPDLLVRPWRHLTGEAIPWQFRAFAWLQAHVQGRSQRAILRNAPFVVSLSPSHTEILRRMNPRVVEIRNPLSAPPPPRAVSDPSRSPTVTFLGRLSWEKGPDVFLDAVATLVRRGIRLSAVLAGDGPMAGWVRSRLMDEDLAGVRFLGWTNDPSRVLAETDVFVLSSRVEAVPLVLIEALASGCNIVATDAGSGVQDILGPGRLGRIVPVEDPESLADAIAETLIEGLGLTVSARKTVDALLASHEPQRVLAQWVELAERLRLPL